MASRSREKNSSGSQRELKTRNNVTTSNQRNSKGGPTGPGSVRLLVPFFFFFFLFSSAPGKDQKFVFLLNKQIFLSFFFLFHAPFGSDCEPCTAPHRTSFLILNLNLQENNSTVATSTKCFKKIKKRKTYDCSCLSVEFGGGSSDICG